MPLAYRDITDEDYRTIRDRMMPYLTRKGKQRPKEMVLPFLAHLWPLRLEFELMRLRGRAFDVDDEGFSYNKGDYCK